MASSGSAVDELSVLQRMRIALLTGVCYFALGWLALSLTEPLGFASQLYPSAGLALAATLVYGWPALVGVWAGAGGIDLAQALQQGHPPSMWMVAPMLIGLGAALQAGVGAAWVRRHVTQPLVLNEPRDILLFSALGAALACLISSTVANLTLMATGALSPQAALGSALTWWTGDTLGVLIGAPLTLTLIGRPAADWRPRRLTLGVPLLVATALVAMGMREFTRLDDQRVRAAFQRSADRLASDARMRLAQPLYALQALHGSLRGAPGGNEGQLLEQASRWWLAQPFELQAMGVSHRIPLAELPAYEAASRRKDGLPYRVFDRDAGAARARDGEVLAVRHIEPLAGNVGAVGVNTLSIPAARAAIEATRDSGQPVASGGFQLTQLSSGETGIVIYQALYHPDPGGEPTTVQQRRERLRGVAFVTVRIEHVLDGLARSWQHYLRWCLVDVDVLTPQRRLAGPPGCEDKAVAADVLQASPLLDMGGRTAELRITADDREVPGLQGEAGWLLALTGLAATSLLGALLLTVTGNSRRTQLAVQASTAKLREEFGERLQVEAALRESESQLRSILDNVPLGVMFLDTQGRIIESNPRVRESLGRSAEQLHRMTVLDLVEPEERKHLRDLQRSLVSGGEDSVVERVRLKDPQGRERVLRVTVVSLRDGQAALQRLVCVVEDITEHLRLEDSEKARHRAEAANRAKSEFVSRMSHELRTPLNAMIGFAQLLGLEHDNPMTAAQRAWAHEIQRAGWHLLEMINETLELARIESGSIEIKTTPLALQPTVMACLALVQAHAARRNITLLHEIANDAQAVMADDTRLKQVLTNLLSNAVKYNRDGGTVKLAARLLPVGPPSGASAAAQVEITVSDTGMGMTPEQVAAMFQPYNRLGREGSGIEGTGIGLVISRSLAELMGGSLQVSSEAQVGTVFTLQLPAATAAVAADEPVPDTGPAPYRERLVHYVEDNETNIEVMRGILAQRPQVLLQTSMLGLDGLAAIRATRPDLILLDMQLPDVHGVELLRHIKDDDDIGHIPVIMVSADATTENVQAALLAGALHYVTKPVDLAAFLALVDGVLDPQDTRW